MANGISIHAAQEGCDISCMFLATSISSDFNPRSPRGLRHNPLAFFEAYPIISIHAAQEGCDPPPKNGKLLYGVISIHAAQEGCDSCIISAKVVKIDFNPRSPRGLRRTRSDFSSIKPYFNPRSPRGLRPLQPTGRKPLKLFQSTQPKRAATNIDAHHKP